MIAYLRVLLPIVFAFALMPLHVQAQSRPHVHPALPQRAMPQAASVEPAASSAQPPARPPTLIAEITLADIGFGNGLRFANLGGHREVFVPLPQSTEVAASNLTLVFDDFSAHDARRNLEVQVNDRTVGTVSLDGKARGRTVRVPLGKTAAKDGYLKVAFLYSGAATLDRCIDVRYVGDSLTLRPESAIEIDLGAAGNLDIATTAALMPRDVAVLLPGRPIAASEMASAITVSRALISSGRRVSYYHGYGGLADLARRDESGHWLRGIVFIGSFADVAGVIDPPLARVAGDLQRFGMIEAVRVRDLPALLIADGEAVRAAGLFASPMLAAVRGNASASVGDASAMDLPSDRVTFDQLGLPPQQAEVFGRAELSAMIDRRRLPAGTRPERLLLDVMVAPDGDGPHAVVSAFVNDRLLGSTIAAIGEATHLDLALPRGLVGATANVRVVVQRASAQGDCRFEPQGYPAQLLGSSALILSKADGEAAAFSDLTSQFALGFNIILPASTAEQPTRVLGLLAQLASQLSPVTASLTVDYLLSGRSPEPHSAFMNWGDIAPTGAVPRVRFDLGRVAVIDRAGHTLLDLGGLSGGAVAQVITAAGQPGLWVRPLSPDGQVPAPAELHLDHGNVAFLDDKGVALAMSTARDALVAISYPDQVSWLTIAARFRIWIIGGFWLLGTAALLLVLQRVIRARRTNTAD